MKIIDPEPFYLEYDADGDAGTSLTGDVDNLNDITNQVGRKIDFSD